MQTWDCFFLSPASFEKLSARDREAAERSLGVWDPFHEDNKYWEEKLAKSKKLEKRPNDKRGSGAVLS